ncbi:MAG: ABC transporter ATP-binding protein, partial [Clostridia bacterium]|nr:ABC transporter ATP-binding protein [Clostridia bacterium]
EEGEIFGFIGPNGAGKSTTIRTLLALIYPSSGTATIFGKDCIRDAPEIAREIGYLPSEVFYYDNMKVMDLLKYSASFYKKDCTKRIKELAEIMSLDLNKKIDDLSLGNKKKVGIVQGLLHEPKLIILDEPTSGLDPLMQQKFFDLLLEENKRGATILFSSHILSEVQRLCNRVAIIKEGKIIKLEKMSALTEDNYKKIKVEAKDNTQKGHFNLHGVSNLTQENKTISFLFKGNLNDIMKKLSEVNIKNVWIEEPSLEEIFMHYYEKEG